MGERVRPGGGLRRTSSRGGRTLGGTLVTRGFRRGGHRDRSMVERQEASAGAKESRAPHSLRRYQPDQVPRVFSIVHPPRCPWRLLNLTRRSHKGQTPGHSTQKLLSSCALSPRRHEGHEEHEEHEGDMPKLGKLVLVNSTPPSPLTEMNHSGVQLNKSISMEPRFMGTAS
jgi:hypothetical protein